MPYSLGETSVDPGLVFSDPMQGFDGGGFTITPTVVITPGQGGGGSGGTLPPPDFTPESPQQAPQILPTLIATASPPGVAGVPWGLLLALIGGLALASGKGRGTRGF